jgi:adenine phosphoribosyltransferase
MELKTFIRDIPDFPKPGVLFRDITPLLKNSEAFREVILRLSELASAIHPTAIVGVESRGFIFGAPLATSLKLPFVPVRKPGKLPAARMKVEYALEYGTSQLDIHQDALARGDRVVIVDDVLATGGTARAAAKLVEMLGAEVVAQLFVIELEFLGGRKALPEYKIASLLRY